MATPSEEVSTSMTMAYGQALKPYHGWAVRPLFLVSPVSVIWHVASIICCDKPAHSDDDDADAVLLACHEGRSLSLKLLSGPGRASGRGNGRAGIMVEWPG
jgi:hypothetical protein